MLFMIIVSLFVALALCCLLLPSIWASITGDELLDAHEAGLALVASRNPVRETGPPACMAKLIMLRHKINQANTRRRSSCTTAHTHARQQTFTFNVAPSIRTPRNGPWGRFGRSHGKQYH